MFCGCDIQCSVFFAWTWLMCKVCGPMLVDWSSYEEFVVDCTWWLYLHIAFTDITLTLSETHYSHSISLYLTVCSDCDNYQTTVHQGVTTIQKSCGVTCNKHGKQYSSHLHYSNMETRVKASLYLGSLWSPTEFFVVCFVCTKHIINQ